MSNIYIEVDKNDLRYIQRKFRETPKNAKRVLRSAINQTATAAMKKIRKGGAAGYTIDRGAFKSQINVQRANLSHLDATIKSQGRPRTLQRFKHDVPSSAADITKSGMKNIINSVGAKLFVASGGDADGRIVQRETKKRYPLRVIVSNSVPKMVEKIYEGERGGQGDMQPFIEKTLHEKVMEQVEKVL